MRKNKEKGEKREKEKKEKKKKKILHNNFEEFY